MRRRECKTGCSCRADESHIQGWSAQVDPVSKLSFLELPLKAITVLTIQNYLFISTIFFFTTPVQPWSSAELQSLEVFINICITLYITQNSAVNFILFMV